MGCGLDVFKEGSGRCWPASSTLNALMASFNVCWRLVISERVVISKELGGIHPGGQVFIRPRASSTNWRNRFRPPDWLVGFPFSWSFFFSSAITGTCSCACGSKFSGLRKNVWIQVVQKGRLAILPNGVTDCLAALPLVPVG